VAQTGRHAVAATPRVRLVGMAAATIRLTRYAVFALVSMALVAVVVGKFALHLGIAPVLTGSMRPTFAPGDAVVTRVVPVSEVHPGTIAVFVPPGESAPFAHRVMTVSPSAKGPIVTTKGDANPQPDAWRAVLHSPRVSVVVTHLPKFGYVLVAVHQRRWRAALIGLIGLVMTFMATRSVVSGSSPSPRVAQGARL
jgi:signal peptidase